MQEEFARTQMIIGEQALNILAKSTVAVFGIGGVGGYVVEALARAGVGHLILIDKDCVDVSNINRQIIALHSTVGKAKTEVMKERILDINPSAKVTIHNCFFLPETSHEFDFTHYDYVVDAVDTITAKIEIICCAKGAVVPVICSMGTGNKLHPEMFEITDISKTSVCPLAKVMRKELKKREIENVKVLFSKEEPVVPKEIQENEHTGHAVPGSISFVPPIAGLMIAGEVIRDLVKK